MKRQQFFWEKTTRENEDMMCSHEYVKMYCSLFI
jgi:hypothetical protein